MRRELESGSPGAPGNTTNEVAIPIPDEVLALPVSGVNLVPGTLRDQLGGDAPTLLVFLRHLGCIFCRETVADLRAISEQDHRFPRVVLAFQGRPTEGRALLRHYWPTVAAIADARGELYDAFGLAEGGIAQMFRPAVWRARSRAQAKGHRQGERAGDIWRMPGVFLMRGGSILWAHEYRHAADHPEYEQIARLAEQARAA